MKNKSILLSIAILSASLLAQTGAFASNILIDESNFQVPTNQVLVGEWNAHGAQATGFDPASLTIVTANETLAALGVVDIHAEWVSPAPFTLGQAQTYRFNIWDGVISGVPTNLSDTIVLTLTGQTANPNNMTIDLSFRSDNLAENGLTPISGAIDIIEDGTFQPLDPWLPSQLTLLNVSFRSDVVPEPSSLALLALGALSLLYASGKRRLAA
jgi:hypothetical protein